jgi:DNA repair exonuclease SbcCD ATPase subunit
MKPTKSEIESHLEKISKALRRSSTAIKNLAETQSDGQQLQKEIDGIGDPGYKDDAAINLLAVKQKKLELCEKTLARLREKLEATIEENGDLLNQGANLVQRVLTPLLSRREESIMASIRPFCGDDVRTSMLAKQTDSYATAYNAIAGFSGEASFARSRGPEAILESLARVESVLKEASKGDGSDMMQFLQPFAAPTASVESETPAAVADEKGGAQ